jgi:hypothetical protein
MHAGGFSLSPMLLKPVVFGWGQFDKLARWPYTAFSLQELLMRDDTWSSELSSLPNFPSLLKLVRGKMTGPTTYQESDV